MSEIRTRPASKEFRSNFDRIFRKADRPRGETVTGSSKGEPSHNDEYIDWGEIKTIICCTDDPHFGG
jgi:hypothetical protein